MSGLDGLGWPTTDDKQVTGGDCNRRIARRLDVGCVVTTNGGKKHIIAKIGFGGSEGIAENCYYHWYNYWPYEIGHAAMNPDTDTIVSVDWPNAEAMATSPCSDYIEDRAVCDDTGDPKGQCANCCYKWYDHMADALPPELAPDGRSIPTGADFIAPKSMDSKKERPASVGRNPRLIQMFRDNLLSFSGDQYTVNGVELNLPCGKLRIGRMIFPPMLKPPSICYVGKRHTWTWTIRVWTVAISYMPTTPQSKP